MHDRGNVRGRETFLGSEKGLTLVEIIIATIILGIAVVSFSYLFGTAGGNIVKLGDQRVCLQLAQQEMEDLLRLPYNDPALAVTNGFDHYRRFKRPPEDIKSQALDGDLFVRWQVSYFDDPYYPNGIGQDYKGIILELYDDLFDEATWSLGSNPSGEITDRERVVTLTTFIAP